MDTKRFWEIIDSARIQAGDWEDMSSPLTDMLSSLDISDIIKWQKIFEQYQHLSNKSKLWAAAYVINGGCSDDGFEYFRGWLIAQGKASFHPVRCVNNIPYPNDFAVQKNYRNFYIFLRGISLFINSINSNLIKSSIPKILCFSTTVKSSCCGSSLSKFSYKLIELLVLLKIGKVYTDGNYAYFELFTKDTFVVTKKNTQKIERNHLSLRTWCARLVRKDIRFSKTEQMHKIVVGFVINIGFFGRASLIQ